MDFRNVAHEEVMNYYQYFSHSREPLLLDRRCCLVTHFLVEGEPGTITTIIHFAHNSFPNIIMACCIVKIIKI